MHELADAAQAQIEAIKLSLREARPELKGRHYSISVTDENGAGICLMPLDAERQEPRRNFRNRNFTAM